MIITEPSDFPVRLLQQYVKLHTFDMEKRTLGGMTTLRVEVSPGVSYVGINVRQCVLLSVHVDGVQQDDAKYADPLSTLFHRKDTRVNWRLLNRYRYMAKLSTESRDNHGELIINIRDDKAVKILSNATALPTVRQSSSPSTTADRAAAVRDENVTDTERAHCDVENQNVNTHVAEENPSGLHDKLGFQSGKTESGVTLESDSCKKSTGKPKGQIVLIEIEFQLEAPRTGLKFIRKPGYSLVYTCGDYTRDWMPCIDSQQCPFQIDIVKPSWATVAVASGNKVHQEDDLVSFRTGLSVYPNALGFVVGQLSKHRVAGSDGANQFVFYSPEIYSPHVPFQGRHVPEHFRFMEQYLGYRFPYSSMSVFFLPDVYLDTATYLTLSIFDATILHDMYVIEQCWHTLKVIWRSFAKQFFGCIFYTLDPHEHWFLEGLAEHLYFVVIRQVWRYDHYQHEVYRSTKTVVEHDAPIAIDFCGDRAPIGCCRRCLHLSKRFPRLTSHGTAAFRAKAFLTMRTVEKRLGDDVFRNVLRTVIDGCTQNSKFISVTRFIDTATSGLTTLHPHEFFKIPGPGHHIFDIQYNYNRRKYAIEVEIKQSYSIKSSTTTLPSSSSSSSSAAASRQPSTVDQSCATGTAVSALPWSPELAFNGWKSSGTEDTCENIVDRAGLLPRLSTSLVSVIHECGSSLAIHSPSASGGALVEEMYRGEMIVGVQELDGYYIFPVQITDRITKVDIPCESRLKRNRKRRVIMPGLNEESNDFSQSCDLNHPILWIRADPEMLIIKHVRIAETEMTATYIYEQLKYHRNVIVQYEAMDLILSGRVPYDPEPIFSIIESSTVNIWVRAMACELLAVRGRNFERCSMIRRYQRRFINSEPKPYSSTTTGVPETKEQESGTGEESQDSISSMALDDINSLMIPETNPNLIPHNDFSNTIDYFLRVSMIRSIGLFPCTESQSQACDLVRFMTMIAVMNENEGNKFTDAHFKAAYIIALGRCVSKNIGFLEPVLVDQVISYVVGFYNFEFLAPSHLMVVGAACLQCMVSILQVSDGKSLAVVNASAWQIPFELCQSEAAATTLLRIAAVDVLCRVLQQTGSDVILDNVITLIMETDDRRLKRAVLQSLHRHCPFSEMDEGSRSERRRRHRNDGSRAGASSTASISATSSASLGSAGAGVTTLLNTKPNAVKIWRMMLDFVDYADELFDLALSTFVRIYGDRRPRVFGSQVRTVPSQYDLRYKEIFG